MQVKTERDDLVDYLTDASNMPGGFADKLFVPESTDEISGILKEADSKRIPVTVSGARTGTVGGAIPFGGYVVSLEKFNKIKEINKETLRARAGAGVILADFQKAVEAEWLFYPPDPTEWSCQLGGTVATNASGARSFKYGATRGYVQGLEVVLADGNIVNISRGTAVTPDGDATVLDAGSGKTIRIKRPTYCQPAVRKNTAGYFSSKELDPIDLFIGSEGTLGIVTEIEFSLLKKPEGFFSGIVFFKEEGRLLDLVNEAKALSFENRKTGTAGIDASFIEYFDENSLKFIGERFPEVPKGAKGAIFFEQETTAQTEDALLNEWNALLEKHGTDTDNAWFTTTEQDMVKMREFRHALPVAVNERIVRYRQKKVGTDMAVPDESFPSFLKFYKQKLDESGLDHVIFGHIGDNHLHANMLPKDEAEAERARHLYGRFIAQALMLGGTISAEHGIGKLKRRYLDVMMGERYLNEMAEIKKALDPNGILGRGNIFDEKLL